MQDHDEITFDDSFSLVENEKYKNGLDKSWKQLKKIFKGFWKLPYPEKNFVLRYPFKFKKAKQITDEINKEMLRLENSDFLDNDNNGGQVSAFRNAFWMAKLAKELSPEIAIKFGKSQEDSTKIMFKKGKLKSGNFADKTSSDMNFKNNEIGIRIFLKFSDPQSDELIDEIINAIITGQLWIIKKDKNGNYLNWQGDIIPPNKYTGKWYTPKCLVPSDFNKF